MWKNIYVFWQREGKQEGKTHGIVEYGCNCNDNTGYNMYDTANKAGSIQMGIQYIVDRINNLYHFFTYQKLMEPDYTITTYIYKLLMKRAVKPLAILVLIFGGFLIVASAIMFTLGVIFIPVGFANYAKFKKRNKATVFIDSINDNLRFGIKIKI